MDRGRSVQPAIVFHLSAAFATKAHVSSPTPWNYALVIGLPVAVACLHVWLVVRIIRSQRSGGDDTDDDGGGPRKDPFSPPPMPNQDPEWWPEFERQFAAYVARRPTLTGTPT